MAFMGRGDFPSMENLEGIGHNDVGKDNHYRHFFHYRLFHYYVPLDNTYVIMQMIVTFIILIVGVITLFITYKTTIIDPIESTKKLFVNIYLIIIGILLALTLVTNFFSKSETSLVKRLVIISTVSILVMLVFFVVKLNLDKTYTRDKFEQFYIEQNIVEPSSDSIKSKINISITGISIETEKEHYINECLKLYDIFSTKVYGTFRTSSFT